MTNTQNLKPFQTGHDERRQIGRKVGSKNVATLVKDLLNRELSKDVITDDTLKTLINDSPSKSMISAVILAVCQKALDGDIRAANLLLKYLDKADAPTIHNAFGLNPDEYE
jgi:hypothetical protein